MDRRLISAVARAGTLFGLIALSAYTVPAANALEPKADISAPSLTSERYNGMRLSWDIAAARSSSKVNGSRARSCAVFEPTTAVKARPRVATWHGIGEERRAPRMALVLGVGF